MRWLNRWKSWRPPPPREWSISGALVLTLLTSLPALGSLGSHHWALDLLSHFRVHYVIASLICALCALYLSRRGLATLFVSLSVVLGITLLPLYVDRPPEPAANSAPLTVLHFNVGSANPHRQEVLAHITARRPDLAFILEVGPEWGPVLEALPAEYRVLEYAPSSDNFGMAAIARVPVQSSRVRRDNPLRLAAIEVRLEWEGSPLIVHGIHTFPPVGRRGTTSRDQQLSRLAREIGSASDSTLVVGDFNATPWSAATVEFEQASRLRNAQRGFGYQPTWPRNLPVVGIPIDPSYHSADLTILEREVGPSLGSDHRSVFIRVARRPSP